MTTLNDVTPKKDRVADQSAEQRAAVELVRLATVRGLSRPVRTGCLSSSTKTVLETALNEERTEHLGHEKPTVAARPVTDGFDGEGQV
ncbi:hypothetical protein [Mycobacteroides chelonae]|uniref:hypothetical protein n=1 Tax=Mycobacteroides chelonae TaxID=1774 RepID=UPI0009933DDD|nr:hypothetical protein [Mycobacteroides chelonae]